MNPLLGVQESNRNSNKPNNSDQTSQSNNIEHKVKERDENFYQPRNQIGSPRRQYKNWNYRQDNYRRNSFNPYRFNMDRSNVPNYKTPLSRNTTYQNSNNINERMMKLALGMY